ncbi:MAG TPA: general stress protein [Candidatus Eremiobacteraceae bacterium]|nr:general stress protein [Candidatus Eremiobacteraceae bacterium]
MDEWVTGIFRDKGAADDAVDDLQKAGYGMNDISVMMTDDTRTKKFAAEKGTKAPEGAAAGGVVGGAIGAILAGVTATGSIAAIAATGGAAAPLVVGPLAAALAGLGAGAVGGGIVGGLIGLGIPEVRAKEYEQKLRDGGILVGVRASTPVDAANARTILATAQASDDETKARQKVAAANGNDMNARVGASVGSSSNVGPDTTP